MTDMPRSDRKSWPGRRSSGLTIIQLMVILGLAGIVITIVVDLIIDKRCSEEPAAMLCKDRSAS